jgi:hypothetical protein
MVEISQDTNHSLENESQQVVTALSGGLISYIRTEGRSVDDSVKKNAPIIGKSQAARDYITADLAWILDETNPLLGNKSLVDDDLAIALDLLENLRSLISSSLNGSTSLPSDPKVNYLLFYYIRLARKALSAQPTLQKIKTYQKLAQDIEVFSLRFDESRQSDRLTSVLPIDLQNRISILVDPTLSGNTVRVHYEVKKGLVANLHIKVGREAKADDVRLHVPTVRLMERYSGLLGRVRLLLKRIRNWITQNGEPLVGSKAWEAKLEVEKLERIIQNRLERESQEGISLEKAIKLEEEIKYLSQQLQRHQQTLDQMELDPGVGYIAADGIPKIDGLEAEEALIQISNSTNEVYNHPESRQNAQEILSSKKDITVINSSTTQKELSASQYTVKKQHGMPSFIRAGNEMEKGQMWKTERLVFEGQPNTEVARQQSWGNVQNKLVKKVNNDGTLDNSRLTYDAIAQELQKIDDPDVVADAIRKWVVDREVSDGYDANTIAKVGTLMFGQEAQRNRSTIITAPMVLDFVAMGGKDWKQAFDLFPMAPDKAVSKNRELNEYLQQWQEAKNRGIELPRLNKGVREAMEWNINLIKTYLDTMGMKFDIEAIKKLTFNFYNYK